VYRVIPDERPLIEQTLAELVGARSQQQDGAVQAELGRLQLPVYAPRCKLCRLRCCEHNCLASWLVVGMNRRCRVLEPVE